MSDAIVYEASIYSRAVTYRNYKGQQQTVELSFALDPIALMQVIASMEPRKVKSGNPAKQPTFELTDEQQIRFVRDLASRAAGVASEDGESWEPFEDFDRHLAGQAFLTKLASSDGDRKEFVEKVILAPFRAFVGFATTDPTNSPKEIQQFKQMLTQMENIFQEKEEPESIDDRRARLAAEMAQLDQDDQADNA